MFPAPSAYPSASRSAREGITSIPFNVRATDVVRHIVNVDSRFRDTPQITTPSDYYFSLLAPIRNVLRVRITSIEFPNNYLFFNKTRRNVSLTFITGSAPATATTITIPDGNYTPDQMATAITDAISASTELSAIALAVSYDESTASFTFTANASFKIDTVGITTIPETNTRGCVTYMTGWDRPFDYGLAYYLGFSRGVHEAIDAPGSPVEYSITSSACANFSGDQYLFLRVNDYASVNQTVSVYDSTFLPEKRQRNEFTALAKLVLREPKNSVIFDDYAGQHIKEFVFTAPTDLSRLHIQLVDAYGQAVDMCSTQFSFSLEVLEVRNLALYDAIRDSLLTLTGHPSS
jgi:hypothetical protein